MSDRPAIVAFVYVTLKSVQSSHLVLSSTDPNAAEGIPSDDGSFLSGGGLLEGLSRDPLDESVFPELVSFPFVLVAELPELLDDAFE